ncbi:MAG: TRAP transporter large permease [Hyphomicrobiales bacterium]|nr:TRAP transporter large permease [Hyphomicrobiales bacterium]
MDVDSLINGGLSFAAVLVLMAFSVPIGISMLVVGFVGFALISGFDPAMVVLGTTPFEAVSHYTLSVMPLFVLMGNLANSAKLSQDLYDAAYAIVGHLKGGLAMSTVGACAGFGMVCGSSIATAATMAQMAGPEMKRHGYSPALTAGSIAAGGTLGIIIPPSVILVVYAYLTEQAIQDLFLAALIPGAIAVVLYMIAIRIYLVFFPNAGTQGEKKPIAERLAAVWKVFPAISIFIIIMLGLYLGFFTATEAAAVGVVLVLCLIIIRGQFSWGMLKNALWSSAKTVGSLYLIVIGASVFNFLITVTQLPFTVVEFIDSLQLSPIGVIMVIVAIYLVLGSLMDSLAMLFLTIPVFFPVVTAAGIDPVWFGVFAVLVVEFGMISPPVGMNLFVIQGVLPDISLKQIWAGTIPFLAADVVRLGLLILFPSMCLYLVELAR